MPIESRPRVLFNPNTRSANFFIPGLWVVLSQVMATMLAATAIGREKENGTLEQLFMTPVRAGELMLGLGQSARLDGLRLGTQLSLFDVAGVTDEAFWDEAEERLREALKHYAEQAADGQAPLRRLFASPYAAATVLVVNGGIMYVGEKLIQRQMVARTDTSIPDREVVMAGGGSGTASDAASNSPSGSHLLAMGRYRDITQLSWRDAAVVGFAQVGALFPGISRSGITMVAGLAAGLTHEAAARYTFLLATPIIGAAGVLEIPQLFAPSGRSVLGDAIIGMVLAGIAAYFSIRYLMRYFEGGRLYPFAYYCVGAGLASLLLLRVGA